MGPLALDVEQGGLLVKVSSWIGSVWSLRAEDGYVIGQVREVNGETIVVALLGLRGRTPEGVEILPSPGGAHRLARVSSGAFVGRWQRMGGAAA